MARLTLERLETRLVPAGNIITNPVNAITGLYRQMLQREPDADGLAGWTSQLQQGVSVADVANGFWTSSEFRGNQINNYYSQYLGRNADPDGFNFWTNQLLSGASEQQVINGFVSSGEFIGNAGSHVAYVENLYLDLLGRRPDATEAINWINALDNGAAPSTIAQGFLTSSEFRSVRVEGLYGYVLDRTADAGGLSYWTTFQVDAFWLRNTSIQIIGSMENQGRIDQLTDIDYPDAALRTLYQAILTADYPEFVQGLADQLGNAAFMSAISGGRGDVLPGDESATSVEVGIDVRMLRPTQNEIVMSNSLNFPLHVDPSVIPIYMGTETVAVAGRPILTGADGTFIIDGHHRWSQLFVINPEARILANDLPTLTDPFTALKASQLTIVADTGDLPSAPGGGVNLLTIGEAEFRAYVESIIVPEALDEFAMFGIVGLEAVTDYLWDNVSQMQTNNQPITAPNAPPRDIMPQTDEADNFFALLQSGMINYRGLYFYGLG